MIARADETPKQRSASANFLSARMRLVNIAFTDPLCVSHCHRVERMTSLAYLRQADGDASHLTCHRADKMQKAPNR